MSNSSIHQHSVNVSRSLKVAEPNVPCQNCSAPMTYKGGPLLSSPEVVLIYWDSHLTPGTPEVEGMNLFVNELAQGSFARRLTEVYQIEPGGLTAVNFIDVNAYPPPSDLQTFQIVAQIKAWLLDGVISPAPRVNEVQRSYLLLPPYTTTIGPPEIGGYHTSAKYNPESANDDLFIGVIAGNSEYAFSNNPDPTVRQFFFLNSGQPAGLCAPGVLSVAVSHELSEMWTDPIAGTGYVADCNGYLCEIGDLCEITGAPTRLKGSKGCATSFFNAKYVPDSDRCISAYALDAKARLVDETDPNHYLCAIDVKDRDTGELVLATVHVRADGVEEQIGYSATNDRPNQLYKVSRRCTVACIHGQCHGLCQCDSTGFAIVFDAASGTGYNSQPIDFSVIPVTRFDVPDSLSEQIGPHGHGDSK